MLIKEECATRANTGVFSEMELVFHVKFRIVRVALQKINAAVVLVGKNWCPVRRLDVQKNLMKLKIVMCVITRRVR